MGDQVEFQGAPLGTPELPGGASSRKGVNVYFLNCSSRPPYLPPVRTTQLLTHSPSLRGKLQELLLQLLPTRKVEVMCVRNIVCFKVPFLHHTVAPLGTPELPGGASVIEGDQVRQAGLPLYRR